jgi:hypothetical protein
MADYVVGQLPADTAPEILRELRAISEAIGSGKPFIRLDLLSKPPKKYGDGVVVLADGVNWNPGSGAGFYGYRAGAWRFLG